MKTQHLIIPALLLFGCSGNNHKADGYGNFTATEIIISSETSGKVVEKRYDEGARVKKGDLIYLIDTIQNSYKRDELIAKRRSVLVKKNSIQAQIGVLKQQKTSMESDLTRFSKMLKDGAATPKQVDDLTNKINVIDKQINQVKTNFMAVDAEGAAMDASLEQINDLIKRSKVTAPINGTILEVYAELGESVAPGKPLFKIADLKDMDLKAYFSGDQLPAIKIGEKVKVVTDDGHGGYRNFDGVVKWISSEAEFTPKIIQTREERVDLTYAVKIGVKNDGTIKINMPGEVMLPHTQNKK